MKSVFWNDPDPRVRWGNPNFRWGSPSYLLEPGDEGYVELQPGQPGYVPPISPPINNPKPKRKMAELTDADQKAFIDKTVATLKQADIKARLTAAGWDPTQRTTNLENGNTSIMNDEGLVSQLEAALSAAVATRRTDLDNNYDLASATVSSIEGALGKDDQLVKDLRQFRGSLSHAPKKPPGGTP